MEHLRNGAERLFNFIFFPFRFTPATNPRDRCAEKSCPFAAALPQRLLKQAEGCYPLSHDVSISPESQASFASRSFKHHILFCGANLYPPTFHLK